MDKAEIPFLSVAELSRLIERKEVSPVEATEACLERIDDLDFKFNAYLTVCREEALQAAQKAEEAIARGNYTRADARNPSGRKGPIVEQGHPLDWRLTFPGRFHPR